jgi:hypothetical protein
MGTIISSKTIAATLYSLGTWFVSGIYIYIYTLHKGDDDDDDDTNNNNRSYKIKNWLVGWSVLKRKVYNKFLENCLFLTFCRYDTCRHTDITTYQLSFMIS